MAEKNTGKKYSTISNLMYILKLSWQSDKSVIISIAVYSLLNAFYPFIGIFAPKLLIDELTGKGRADVLVWIIVGMLIISLISGYLIDSMRISAHSKTDILIQSLKRKISEKALTMKFEYTEEPDALDKLQAAREAVSMWGEGIVQAVFEAFTFLSLVFAIIGYFGIMATLHPIIIAIIVINVTVVFYLNNKAKKKELEILPKISSLVRKCSYIETSMADFEYGKDIRLYNMSDWLSGKAWKYKKERISEYYNLQKVRFLPKKANGIILFFREVIVYGYLVLRYIQGAVTTGNFMMYFNSISSMTNTLMQMIESFVRLKGQAAYADVYRSYLEIEDEDKLSPDKIQPIPKSGEYEIEFKNVRFAYPHGKKDIYKNLNLKIKAGQKLAIVGVNGAGKTTFVKLLARLYDPQGGCILINGKDIRTFDREEYWKMLSIVFQEVKTFAFSVAENVAMTNDFSKEKVIEAIEKAGLKDKIYSLDKGIDTQVLRIFDEKGIEFSGGESQKISLARALYKDAPIVVLDEPTSALDALAESRIYEQFNDMVRDKTAIYISHRLASTRFCDVIAFFENGEIVEYGTHRELMALGGKYADMFNLQAHYYQNDTEKTEEVSVSSCEAYGVF